MGFNSNKYLWLLFGGLSLTSCSNTKYLKEGDSLYTGSKVTFKDHDGRSSNRKILQKDLENAVAPKPNSKVLGVRLKLSIYNLAGDTSKKGLIRNAIRNFGEPPVLASGLNLPKNKDLLINILENKGFFYPEVVARSETKKRKTNAYFDVWTGPQYHIRKVTFPLDSSELTTDINKVKEKSLLRPGLPYNLDLIKGERDRITKELTERGYYYFNSDYLIAKVDSSAGKHEVDIYMQPKHEEIPEQAYYIYRIRNVFVYPNFHLNRTRADTSKADASFQDGFYLIDRSKSVRPLVFRQAMQFQPDDIYNRTEQNLALNRLVTIGNYKFVKNRFDPVDNPADPRLDVYYYLTPYPKKSLRFEVGVQSRDDSRMGTSSSISWRNRNTFRGAELLAITLRGAYEGQAGGNVQRPPAVEGGIEVSLSVPRFVIPFVNVIPSGMFIPRTTIRAGYDVSLRRELYLIHSLRAAYGYEFKEDIRKGHRLFPININYVRTDTLGTPQISSVNLSNILFNGLIIGPTYQYIFNSQAAGIRRDNYYFDGLVDFSNNILGLIQGGSPEEPAKIFNTSYAQYLKFQADGRYYFNYAPVHKNNMWASRIILGYGYPWGNSSQLPNIKQFFSGGASSLRGFPSRMVGPGTFNDEYLYGDAPRQRFIEMLGDVKLEINTELRTHLYQFLNAAFFIDAGNIWTFYDDSRFPGGRFSADFYKELAVNGGLGLRLDFNILLLRLDLGIPFRKPWLPESERWVFNQINFGDPSWRSQNLIFNLAIGYPF